MPHSHCFMGRTDLLSLYIFGDLLAFISYMGISIILIFTFKRSIKKHKEFNIALSFALFIFFCGVDHLLSIDGMYTPRYYFHAINKVMMGVVSITSLFMLPGFLKRIFSRIEADAEYRECVAKEKAINDSLLKKSRMLKRYLDNLEGSKIKIDMEEEKKKTDQLLRKIECHRRSE